MYVGGEYGLGVFSERLTVSCLANPRLGKGATTPCASSIPNGLSRTAIPPPVTPMSHASPYLPGLSPRANNAIPSVAASEAIREIASESDRQFA